MGHASGCFARLVRCLLGPGAIAQEKVESGASLCILGVDIALSWNGFTCRPAAAKIMKWLRSIDDALGNGRLLPGDAMKLAGRLSWGCSQTFKRFGRAMLRPIFDQVSRRDGAVDAELRRALAWWKSVLALGLSERHDWRAQAEKSVAHVFCDASGDPAHLGAVAFIDDRVLWTHMAPPPEVVAQFRRRRDNQIMGLELLAISLGMSTFEELLCDRTVVFHCDNSGSEVLRVWPAVLFVLCLLLEGVCAPRHCKVLGPRAVGSSTMAACTVRAYANLCGSRCHG